MGTKNEPGKFDCYANAKPDEPMFVLLGRDPVAAHVVRVWAALRTLLGDTGEQVREANLCAKAMEAWATDLGKEEKVESSRIGPTALVRMAEFRALTCAGCQGTIEPGSQHGCTTDCSCLGAVWCAACRNEHLRRLERHDRPTSG